MRAALYTGEAEARAGDYFGIAPNRGGRLRAIAYGGQTICSQATYDMATTAAGAHLLPPDVTVRDLGLHRLRDLARAERIYQVVHPELPDEFPPLRSLGVRHNLPARRTTFVGRARERVAVQKHLEVERLVTLTGIGGCGKTRLAIEVAAEQLERFADGVFFVDLAPVTDAAVVPAAIAAAVGFSRLAIGTGSGRPATELIDYLSTRKVLLVVDNCEQVLEACAALVDEILERCPGVSILATSREALDLQGEQIYPLPPLDVAGDSLLAADSAVLFAARAALVRPDFDLSSAAPEVEEICRHLDGLPLAIELAAAQVAHMSPHQIIERLDDGFHLLTGGRGRAPRQQTLHAALDWSHDLLDDGERAVFRRLAVFPGNFSYEAAVAVCDEAAAFDRLRSLVRKSLIVMEDAEAQRRYRLLETVRAYADERLTEASEREAVRDRHRDYFLAWAESIPPERTFLDPDGSVRLEGDNLRAALGWSQEQGRRDLVGRLASTMLRLWVADVEEGRRWLSTGLEAVGDLDPERRVRVAAVAAYVAVLAMKAADGELARRAVEVSGGQPGVWSSLGHGLLCLNAGIRGIWTGDESCAAEAEQLGQQAVELAPEPLSRGIAWFWLGNARVLLDDLEGATDALRKGSVEAIPGGDMSPVSLAMLACALHLRGLHDEALAAAAEVLERASSFNRSGLWAWELYCSLPYGLELGTHGRDDEAMTFLRDLLQDSGTPLTPSVTASAVVVLGALAQLRGDVESAALLLDRGGVAMLVHGIRTPVDLALQAHYQAKVNASIDEDVARRVRDRAAEMSVDEALALGLRIE